MSNFDYRRIVEDEGFSLSSITRLFSSRGLKEGRPQRRTSNYIEQFVRELLRAKGIRTFGDLLLADQKAIPNRLLRYKLTLVALDITTQQTLRLPQDFIRYGLDPNEVEVEDAVLMSTIDQAFFKPITLPTVGKGGEVVHQIVGAGILEASLFDMPGIPDRPTFNICIVDDTSFTEVSTSPPLLYRPTNNMIQAIWSVNAAKPLLRNEYHLDDTYVRTISIPASGISAETINLTKQQAQTLYENGRREAQKFFSTWDFEAFKAAFRSGSLPSTRIEYPRVSKK